MTIQGARDRIEREVTSWPGVEAKDERFGGRAFVLGRRELGHVHGDAQLDAPVTRAEHDDLIARGIAQPHHVIPASGWITLRFRSEEDVAHALGVLRGNYERASKADKTMSHQNDTSSHE